MEVGNPHKGFEKVKVLKMDDVAVSEESVKNQTYPWVRPLNLIINTSAKNMKVDQFVEFMLTDEGQKIIQQQGYIPIN